MGNEPNEEPSASSQRRLKHKVQLYQMINQYGKDGVMEVTNLLREIIEEEKHERSTNTTE